MSRVAAAGIRVLAVTDHDTVAALQRVAERAAHHGLGCVPGIEITAVEDGRDVHVLGYGFDVGSSSLAEFLHHQRASRMSRVHAFGQRFGDLGMPIDVGPLLELANAPGGRSVGRGHVARLLVKAGHVASIDEAFTQWLSPGRPGFVPRQGAPVRAVVAQIEEAGGIASLAHPGLLHDDGLVERVLSDGLLAIEAYHTEHDEQATQRYVAWARRAGLAVSGGSDYHGEASNRERRLGGTTLPPSDYEALRRFVEVRTAASWPHVH